MLQKSTNNNWIKSPLGEKAFEVRDLYEPKENESLKYVGLEHIEQQALRLASIGLSSDTVSTKKIFRSGDILFGSLRPYFRKVVMPKFDGVCSTDITVIRARPDTGQMFLRYFISNQVFIDHASNISSGTRMPRANWKVLANSEWLFPSITTQIKIASILSAYDDLIENNMRRIKILEEMAQLIYREWFVHFRFPGHEKVKMVDSPLGKIPNGWKVNNVDKLLEYHIGGGWGKENSDNKHTVTGYVIRGTDIPLARYGSIEDVPLRIHKKSNLQSRILHDGDIVFEVSGGSKGQPVGRALYISEKLLKQFDNTVICASFCKLLRPDRTVILPELFYLHLQEIYKNKQIMQYQVQSTGITNFKFEHFLNNDKLPVPINEIQYIFANKISPVFDYIQILGHRNTILRKTRDLLLPKLISGEIDVEKLEINNEGISV